MNSTTKIALGAAALVAAVSTASAEPYTDYSPNKGVWSVTTVKIDPNHIDDYLVGLKKSWVPGEEMSKRRGLIDDYFVMINANAADPAGNVLLGEHYVSFAAMDPDKARDMDMLKESRAQMSKDEGRKLTDGFDKYRNFVNQTMWTSVNFGK